VGRALDKLRSAMYAAMRALRLNTDIAALLTHGALTDAASDILAQVISKWQ